MVDRPADTLYQHLDALRCAGFVVEAGERREARHHERLFGAAADDFAMEFSDVFPSERHAAIKKQLARSSARSTRASTTHSTLANSI